MKEIRSFGRIKGRKLRDRQQDLFDNLLPKFAINDESIIEVLKDNQDKQIILEIGFGHGEHIINQAKHNKDKIYIGAEPFINGVVALLNKLDEEKLDNIFVYHGDVRNLISKIKEFARHKKNKILDEIYILFPDPWPKTKHFKRRIINLEFIKELSFVLKDNHKLFIASDHESYLTWIFSVMNRSPNFKWLIQNAKEWDNPHENWCETKYYKKAIREGRRGYFLTYIAIY